MSAPWNGNEPDPCPRDRCDGSGWILDENDQVTQCACRADQLTRASMSRIASVIPVKFRDVAFGAEPVTVMDPLVVDRVTEYCDALGEMLAGGRGLWFTGPTGTGKTTLAMLISKTALELGHSVAIYSVPDLLSKIRHTYEREKDEDDYERFLGRLVAVDLLQLDDLGAEKSSDWVLEQLYSLVNRRYEKGRSLTVTTNLDAFGLEREIGSRVVSRLSEMCAEPIEVSGMDHRRLV